MPNLLRVKDVVLLTGLDHRTIRRNADTKVWRSVRTAGRERRFPKTQFNNLFEGAKP